MASTSETGHAKNVTNFEDLISFCNGYGGSYNPSKPSIQIPNLQSLRVTAQATITNLTATNTAFINTTNARQAAFNPLKPLATRIVNALDATEASDTLVQDAKTINRKLQGQRSHSKLTKADAGKVANEAAAEPKNISVSQQSYDSLIENFKKLIELVMSEPTYTPNEPELQVTTLTAQAADLEAKNTAVIDATTNLSNARITRNKTLYNKDTGLVDIAGEVKKYVKSVFGATSPEYKQVSKIKFTNPR